MRGFAVALLGWAGIFWVNVPVTLVGLVLAWRCLPPDRQNRSRNVSLGAVLRELDFGGVLLFALAVVGLLSYFLSVAHGPNWPLLAPAYYRV